MANKQPFYHRMEILFTATSDRSHKANSKEFLKALDKFLTRELSSLPNTTSLDSPVDSFPGETTDLM